MVVSNIVYLAIFFAFFGFGAYKLAIDDNVSNEMKERILNMTFSNPLYTSVNVKMLDDLTPTVSFKLPFTEKKFFGINEYPVPSWSIGLIMITGLFIVGKLLRLTELHIFKKILLLIVALFILYYIATWIIYGLYLGSASKVGFTKDEALIIREQYNNGFEGVMLPLIFLGLFTLVSVFATMKNSLKK